MDSQGDSPDDGFPASSRDAHCNSKRITPPTLIATAIGGRFWQDRQNPSNRDNRTHQPHDCVLPDSGTSTGLSASSFTYGHVSRKIAP